MLGLGTGLERRRPNLCLRRVGSAAHELRRKRLFFGVAHAKLLSCVSKSPLAHMCDENEVRVAFPDAVVAFDDSPVWIQRHPFHVHWLAVPTCRQNIDCTRRPNVEPGGLLKSVHHVGFGDTPFEPPKGFPFEGAVPLSILGVTKVTPKLLVKALAHKPFDLPVKPSHQPHSAEFGAPRYMRLRELQPSVKVQYGD